MEVKKNWYMVDKQRLLNITSVTMFIHVLCGLMRYLVSVNAVLAVDYLSTATLLLAAVTHCVQQYVDPRVLIRGCREHLVLFLFLTWCIISQIVNVVVQGSQSAYFLPNALHDTLLIVLVFFPFGRYASRYSVPKLGSILLKVLIVLWTAFIAFMLVNVFRGRVVHLPGDIRLGVYDGRSFRLNNNENHTSCFEFAFMILCIFEVLISKKRIVKVLYAIFGCVHFTGMVLSDSRTFLYSSLVFCAAFMFYISYRILKAKQLWFRMLLSVLIAVSAAASLYALRLAVWEAYEYMGERNMAVQMVIKEKTDVVGSMDSETDKKEFVSNKKSLIYEKRSTLTGRTLIWEGCIKALFSDPVRHFFGMGVANSKELVNEVLGAMLYTHNQFLEVFVCVGIPGLVLFVIFVSLSLKNALTALLSRDAKMVYAFLALCIPILLIANSFEALLLFYRRPGSYLFYLCCGFLCEYVKRLRGDESHSVTA